MGTTESKRINLISGIVTLENQIDHVFDEKIPIHERIKDLNEMSIPELAKRYKQRSEYFERKLE